MHTATFSFTEEYNKLNPAQQRAVETIDGPVLVIAGPGTGKTQILAARIGNILDKGAAFAENILCLTYTEAGVTAMRKRLIKFIGTEAYKVNIHTFHSFCNKVIQDYPDTFGFGEREPISELEEIELFEKLIDGFGKNHPLKRWRGDIYYEISRLKNLFSTMKKENISAKTIENLSLNYLESLPSREDFVYKRKSGKNKAGDPKQNLIDKEKERLGKTIAAAKEFENYQELKRQAKRYDYDDMIMDVLAAFQNNEWLLGRYQEQFQYFLVDEYQDTNGAQNEILKLMYSYWDSPNVFVVGDDDQSIYRFQGANLENIVNFYSDTLKKLDVIEQQQRIIVLKNNYRSSQEILDLSALSIQNNQERLVNQIHSIDLDKTLVASGLNANNKDIHPFIVSYPNASHETADIANQIVALKIKGVKLSEIGVLYNQHKQSDDLIQCLNQKGIEVSTRKKVDILSCKLTNQLINILTYIQQESKIAHSREDLLFDLLHYPFFKIQPIQAARLSFELRESRYSNPKTTWREAFQNLEKIFDKDSVINIHAVGKLTDKWQLDLRDKPVQLLFQSILNDIECLSYIENHPEKVWLLQELKTLFDFVKQENQKHPNLSLAGFLETIDQLKKYRISIPYVKSSYSDEAVQMTSIHGSKGLEYEYVFLLGCTSNIWEKKRKINSSYPLPEGIFETLNKDSFNEDLRRLFFVAITRAKKHLHISYYEQDEKGKNLTPSMFIEEISENSNLEFLQKHLSDEDIFCYNVLQMLQDRISPELIEANMLKSRLESYKMSVTHLNNYLKCPLKFYYHNFIQIPQAKNASLAFGSAVHDAIEQLFKEMKEADGKFPGVDSFIEMGKKQMFKQQDSFTKKEYKQKLSYLENFFQQFYEFYVKTWNTDVNFEKKLEAVYDGINLTGKIDKIEFNGKNITMVDYKTGQYNSSKKKKFQRPSDTFKNPETPTLEEVYGGDYWRQAVFYKILMDYSINTYQRDWHLERTEFDFVEPDANKGSFHKEQVVISLQDVVIVKEQIKETWKNIQELKFDGCAKEDCEFCMGELEKLEEDV